MKIEKCEIPISDLVEDYWDDAEEGVTGYFGRLDIRPPYQREFVYKPAQRGEVIRTYRDERLPPQRHVLGEDWRERGR